LTGKLLTGRDAAHKRLTEMLDRGEKLPVDFRGRFIYYVGPVDPVRGRGGWPAGRRRRRAMDKYNAADAWLRRACWNGGKSERGPAAIEAIKGV